MTTQSLLVRLKKLERSIEDVHTLSKADERQRVRWHILFAMAQRFSKGLPDERDENDPEVRRAASERGPRAPNGKRWSKYTFVDIHREAGRGEEQHP